MKITALLSTGTLQDTNFTTTSKHSIEPVCGSKHRGLVDLERFIAERPVKNIGRYTFTVPLFQGISPDEMQEYFAAHIPEIFLKWQKLGESYHSAENIDAFLSDEFTKKILYEIQNLIIDHIHLLATNPSDCERFLGLRITELLNTLRDAKKLVIVRSTSPFEDTKNSPNAGGYGSFISKTDPPSVVLRTLDVLCSYFDITPLRNTLQAGINPFELPLQLPLLFQEYVPSANSIGIVAFAPEPNYSKDSFTVTTLTCTHGSLEVLVKSGDVNCDTVYLTRSPSSPDRLSKVYHCPRKKYQMVEDETTLEEAPTLVLRENEPKKQDSPCLNNSMLGALWTMFEEAREYFGYAVDMEIKLVGDTFHLLQQRAVVRPATDPSYFGVDTGHPLFSAKTLVCGASNVQVVHSNEVLFADSLYLATFERKAIHKVVVVEKKEETKNSHAIIIFSSTGTHCYQSSKRRAVESLVNQLGNTSIVSCPQSGRLIPMLEDENPLLNVHEGFYSHPAPLAESLRGQAHPLFFPAADNKTIRKQLLTIIEKLQKTASYQEAAKLLEEISQHPFWSALKEIKFKGNAGTKGAMDLLTALEKKIQKVIRDIKACYSTPKPRLEILFHIKRLQTLLIQPFDGHLALSLSQVNEIMNRASRLETIQGILKGPLQFPELLSFGEVGLFKEIREKWYVFHTSLEVAFKEKRIERHKIEKFVEYLKAFHRIDIMPLWLHSIFLNAASGASKNTFDILMEQLKESDLPFLAQIEQHKNEIKQLKLKIENYLPADMYVKMLNIVEGHFKNIKDLAGERFTTPIVTHSLSQYTRDVVDLLDSFIKEVMKSKDVDETRKQHAFKEMLAISCILTKLIAYDVVHETNIPLIEENNLNDYFKRIDRALRDAKNTVELSEGSSAEASTLASHVKYQRHPIKTLGDLFTILHKNQQYLLSLYDQLHFGDKLRAFENSQPLLELFIARMQERPPYRKAFTNGTDFSSKAMTRKCSIPVRNHSSAITITCKKDATALILECSFYGEKRVHWKKTLDYMQQLMQLLHSIKAITLVSRPHQIDEEIKFKVKVETTEQVNFITELFLLLEEFSEKRQRVNIQVTIAKCFSKYGILEKFMNANHASCLKDIYAPAKLANPIPYTYTEYALNNEQSALLEKLYTLVSPSDQVKTEINNALSHLAPSSHSDMQTYFAYLAHQKGILSPLVNSLLSECNNLLTEHFAYIVEVFLDITEEGKTLISEIQTQYDPVLLSETQKQKLVKICECINFMCHRPLEYAVETYIRKAAEKKTYDDVHFYLLEEMIRNRKCSDIGEQILQDAVTSEDPQLLVRVLPVMLSQAKRGMFSNTAYVDLLVKTSIRPLPMLEEAFERLNQRKMYSDQILIWARHLK